MGDIWNVHDLWLMYGTYASNGRHMEHSHFTVDVQGTPCTMEDDQNTETDKAQTKLPRCIWN